jgi:subfamily B ATP-binding cassette protein MsbA
MRIKIHKYLLNKFISKSNLWLAGIVKQNWKLGLASTILGLITSVLEGLSASLVLPLTTYLSQKGQAISSAIFPQPIEQLAHNLGVNDSFVVFILAFWLLIVLKNSFKYFSTVFTNKLKFFTGKIIREKLISKFLGLELAFYTSAKVGELTTLINDHAERCQTLSGEFFNFISEFTTILCLLTVATYLSPLVTLISMISFGILVIGLKPLLGKIKKQSRGAANKATEFSGLITEILDGIRVIKAFGLERNKRLESKIQLDSRCKSDIDVYSNFYIIQPLTETIGITILLLLITLLNFWASSNSTNFLPTLLTYTVIMLRTLPRINNANNILSQFSVMAGSLNIIHEFMYRSDADHQQLDNGYIPSHGFMKEISLNDISFKYPQTDKYVVKNLSLAVKNGQKVALVGQSGSGKSTLVDLIMRYYDPSEGNILIDGIDLKKINLSDWRSSIAVVSQDTFLFNTSILENIRYGKLDAANEEIIEAASNAYALEFIQGLPDGFNTLVGQRGAMLSGGQKQRIAIARAFLRNPKLLILDEATSALDTASEIFVQKAIDKISEGRTVITIAHRLSTIKNADVIIVMKSGEIVEVGSHDQLIANQSEYWVLNTSK